MKTLYKLRLSGLISVLIFFACNNLFASSHLYVRNHNKFGVIQVTVEGRENPLGINTLTPSFSWKLESNGYDVVQTAYRITVGTNVDLSKAPDIVWDSNWIPTSQSLYNRYDGNVLQPGTTYYYKVEVKDNKGKRRAKPDTTLSHWFVG